MASTPIPTEEIKRASEKELKQMIEREVQAIISGSPMLGDVHAANVNALVAELVDRRRAR